MDMNMVAVSFLTAVATGGVAYVFVYPLLSGEARAEKRQKTLVRSPLERRVDRLAAAARWYEQGSRPMADFDAVWLALRQDGH